MPATVEHAPNGLHHSGWCTHMHPPGYFKFGGLMAFGVDTEFIQNIYFSMEFGIHLCELCPVVSPALRSHFRVLKIA